MPPRPLYPQNQNVCSDLIETPSQYVKLQNQYLKVNNHLIKLPSQYVKVPGSVVIIQNVTPEPVYNYRTTSTILEYSKKRKIYGKVFPIQK